MQWLHVVVISFASVLQTAVLLALAASSSSPEVLMSPSEHACSRRLFTILTTHLAACTMFLYTMQFSPVAFLATISAR